MMGFTERYGPWALIAGASEGTGAAFAQRIAREGVNCILLARRTGPLDALADELRAEYGVECVTASVDLGAADALDQMKAAVGDREVGLFVSNAGADPNHSSFLGGSAEAWAQLIQMNVMTAMQACHHFAAPMRARGRGGILLVNSGACYGGGPGLAVYSGAKAFLLAFTEGLWVELKDNGVDVLTLVLGRTDTPAYRQWREEQGIALTSDVAQPDDVAEEGISRLAHGPIRNFGLEDDVAGQMPVSADARRQRVLMIQKAMQAKR
jgi:short-subunit dehydrogenase